MCLSKPCQLGAEPRRSLLFASIRLGWFLRLRQARKDGLFSLFPSCSVLISQTPSAHGWLICSSRQEAIFFFFGMQTCTVVLLPPDLEITPKLAGNKTSHWSSPGEAVSVCSFFVQSLRFGDSVVGVSWCWSLGCCKLERPLGWDLLLKLEGHIWFWRFLVEGWVKTLRNWRKKWCQRCHLC